MIKFEEEATFFVQYNEELLKAVFVKPSFCMRVFRLKNEENQEILFNIKSNLLKTIFFKTSLHCNSDFVNELLKLHRT